MLPSHGFDCPLADIGQSVGAFPLMIGTWRTSLFSTPQPQANPSKPHAQAMSALPDSGEPALLMGRPSHVFHAPLYQHVDVAHQHRGLKPRCLAHAVKAGMTGCASVEAKGTEKPSQVHPTLILFSGLDSIDVVFTHSSASRGLSQLPQVTSVKDRCNNSGWRLECPFHSLP